MWLLVLANCLLGALLGIRCRVWILVPLSAIPILEVGVLVFPATWISMLWQAGVLIVSLEVGYLVGNAIGVFLESHRHLPMTARQLKSSRVSER